MKRLIVAALIYCLAGVVIAAPVSVSSLQVTERGSAGLDFTVTIDDISQPDASGAIPDVVSYTEDGRTIPTVTRWVAVPAGHRVDLTLLGSQTGVFEDYSDLESQPVVFSNHLTDSQDLDPSVPVRVGRTLVFRGVPIAPITIYPVQLNRQNDGGIVNRELNVRLDFVPDPNGAPVARPINDHFASEPRQLLDRLLLNPPRRDPGESQSTYSSHILILHQDDLNEQQGLPWIDSLATWKRQMGYKVSVEAVDVDQGPLRIREFVRGEYYDNAEDPISHLILIGTWENFTTHFPTGADELGDHYYTLMDGNDEWSSDITLGRIFVRSYGELAGAIKRTIMYEREPFNEDVEWYSRALFTAENVAAAQWVPSMIHLGRWVSYKLRQAGYDPVDTLWSSTEDDVARVNQRVGEILEEGVGLAISRGWLDGCMRGEDRDEPVDTDRRNPFVIAITCLSHERGYDFFSAAELNDLRGSVAHLLMHGLTHTKGNNNILGWSVLGISQLNLHQPGIIQLLSKYQVISDLQYDNDPWGEELAETFAAYELLGDPTVNIYTREPFDLDAEHLESLSVGSTGFNVLVTSDDDSDSSALVTIWQEGGVHYLAAPGSDGWARFTFDSGELEEGEMALTITHPDAFPYHAVIDIAPQDIQIDLAEIDFDDDDGLFGNGDTITTTLTLHNNGDDDADDLRVELFTENPLVILEESEFAIEEIVSDDVARIEFDIILHPFIPVRDTVRVDIKVTTDNNIWQHAFTFVTSAPSLVIDGFSDEDEPFERGETVQITPVLLNIGDLTSPAIVAGLISLDTTIAMPGNEGLDYETINPDDNSDPENGSFEVEISDLAIPGSSVRFVMFLVSQEQDNQFTQAIPFEMIVAGERVSDPYGPDSYGYVCFDSGDDTWAKKPDYDWIEINRDRHDWDFRGTRLENNDYNEDLDSSVVVDLPFEFQYYGEIFNEITVNSNGWIAFGSQWASFPHFRNWRIPGIQGPDAQVCALWQDLIEGENVDFNGIYYYFDEDRGVFIIEWSNMVIFRHRDEASNEYRFVEFQILLFDEDRYPTSTGDGEIKIQYKTFEAFEGNLTDTKYATVGIKNLDGTDGLEYTWWDQYPVRCQPLRDEMALLFTVDRVPVLGAVQGRIVLREDQQQGLAGATVRSLRDPDGIETQTDDEGYFTLDPLPAGADILECSLAGYNNARFEVTIRQDSTVEVGSIPITHPEIDIDPERIQLAVRPGHGTPARFTIGNSGNGPMTYRIERRYPDGSQTEYAETWKLEIASLDRNNRIIGCQFVDDSLYVTGAGRTDELDSLDREDNFIFVLDRQGNEIRSFRQPSYGPLGFKDLAWDGEYLYGGEDSLIVKFDRAGNRVADILHGISYDDLPDPYALAWNPHDNTLYMAKENSAIYKMNLDGEILDTIHIRIPGETVRVLGMAWNPADDDNMQLYLMDWNSGYDNRRRRLAKVNHITGEGKIVTSLSGDQSGKGRALSIGYSWDRSQASLAVIEENFARDTLRVYEIGPNSGYMYIRDLSGTLDPQEEVEIYMVWESGDLPQDSYPVGLHIANNSAEDSILKQMIFVVNDNSNVEDGSSLPAHFSLEQAYPNPFNGTTRIAFTLDHAAPTKLTVYDIAGRRVATLVDEKKAVGRHEIVFESEALASGIYIYRLESAGRSSSRRMVLLR